MKFPTLTQIRKFFYIPSLTELRYILFYFSKFWTNVKLRGYQKALRQAIVDQKVDKIIAKDLIVKDILKAMRVDARSKYIPFDNKNNEEIRMMIQARHGDKMRILGIKVKPDLTLV